MSGHLPEGCRCDVCLGLVYAAISLPDSLIERVLRAEAEVRALRETIGELLEGAPS